MLFEQPRFHILKPFSAQDLTKESGDAFTVPEYFIFYFPLHDTSMLSPHAK